MRLLLGLLAVSATLAAWAGTLTVTSPTENSFLGTSNTLRFNITGASVEVTVTAVIVGPGGTTTTSDKFTPDSDGKITGTLPLNFNTSAPEGPYTITVSATEPGNTYTSSTVHVTVDVQQPKLEEFSPVEGQFVKGTVTIRATIRENNVKDWTVQVNGQDISNNTGTGNTVTVPWDTSNIQSDGSQRITIRVRDQANNTLTKDINVTLDRVKPVVTIAYPPSSPKTVPGTIIPVLVDVVDANTSSVDVTGIDVIAKRLDGSFITRVARISYRSSGSNTMRWTGRIKSQRGQLPKTFLIVVTAIDRAGNVAAPQQVQVKIG